MVYDQFGSPHCALLQILAATKNDEDVWDIADAAWDDGSAGDCISAIAQALETGQQFPEETPVWYFFLGGTAYMFVGSEPDVRARINALP